MNLNQVEAAALNYAASLLEQFKPQIESTVGPLEISVINGALKIGDAAFAKLPFGLGGLIDQALASYASTVETDLSQYTGNGIDGIAAYLKAVAAKLQAS